MPYIQTLKTGDLAYYDSMRGCLPVKVLSIVGPSGNPSSEQKVTVRFTGNRIFKRGETLEAWGLHVLPRKSVHGNRIRHYMVQGD
jgi:hypothetical protein